MDFANTDFKFYDIDQGDQEKLIEMWKHFNPKDEIEPVDAHQITIKRRKEKSEVITNYALMFNLMYPVFLRLAPVDVFYRTCLHLRMQKPVDYMHKHFISKHTVQNEVVLEDVPEENKQKRKSKKKE